MDNINLLAHVENQVPHALPARTEKMRAISTTRLYSGTRIFTVTKSKFDFQTEGGGGNKRSGITTGLSQCNAYNTLSRENFAYLFAYYYDRASAKRQYTSKRWYILATFSLVAQGNGM
eukprot:1346726-Amorphochlora_amoeboformis.AAC.1